MVEQMTIYETRGAQDPAVYALETLAWIDANWGAWWKLVEMCRDEANDPKRIMYKLDENGETVLTCDGEPVVDHIVRIRRGDLYMLAQMRGMSISMCGDFRFNNNMWPSLSRYMLMFRPSISKAITPAQNYEGVDSLNLFRMWRDFKWSHPARASVFIPCERWQDAAGLVKLGDVSAA